MQKESGARPRIQSGAGSRRKDPVLDNYATVKTVNMNSRLRTLREQVAACAENRPGVYHMLDPHGSVLYVGKSVRVRARLLSYFRADRGEKAAELLSSTHAIRWDYVPNEFAALVRELRLIQQSRPRYNVEHNHPRPYAFIKLTAEPAPRLTPVTRVVEDDALYYGPFPSMLRVREALRELAKELGLRDCPGATPMHFADQTDLFALERQPLCFRADLGTCLAPCAGRCSQAQYLARVAAAVRFLDGTCDAPLDAVRRRMADAARRLDFEYAALLRDRQHRLAALRSELVAFRGAAESLSCVYPLPGFAGDHRLYLIRRGRVRDELPAPRSAAQRRTAAERVRELFTRAEPGPAALDAAEVAEILLVARWFRRRPRERRRAVSPEVWLARGA